MSVLALLAGHNEWANRRIFEAAAHLSEEKLRMETEGYASVIGILRHLVQVEHAFFELAHGRPNTRITAEALSVLRELCARLDRSYVEHARDLERGHADRGRFLVPWFGFEITLTEGVLQPLTHAHKHRADVSMLLPRLGGEGVEMDLIQWLDEERGSR
jgi:uncharacterized damage-inducible protein DinB